MVQHTMPRLLPLLIHMVVWCVATMQATAYPSEIKRMPGSYDFPEEVVTTLRPHEYLKGQDIPPQWHWGNVSGANYLTATLNQVKLFRC